MTRRTENDDWTWGPRGRGHPLGRLALFVVVTLVANLLHGVFIAGLLLRAGGPGRSPAPGFGAADPAWGVLLAAVSFLPIALGLTYLFHAGLDRVPWSALWLPRKERAFRATLIGALAGLLILASTALVLVATGSIDAVRRGDLIDQGGVRTAIIVAVYAAGFLCQSSVEEIIFRGYLFRLLGRWRGGGAAVLGSALLFALAHGLNPSGGVLALVNTFLVGALLGLIRSRYDLWSAIGLHASWNLLLALSGVPLSGFPLPGLAAVILEESAAWSGGSYGVEASVAVTAVVTLGTAALLVGRTGRTLSREWWWRSPAGAPPHPE